MGINHPSGIKLGGKKKLRTELTAENYPAMCQVHAAAVDPVKMFIEKSNCNILGADMMLNHADLFIN